MKWFKGSRWVAATFSVLLLVASCGGRSASSGTDSNTHWLKDCRVDADCGGLSCICGVCSKPCVEVGDCSAFGPGAACEVPRACDDDGAPTACVQTGGGGGTGATGGGAGTVGGAVTGTAGAGGGPLPDPQCPAMDARANGQLCAGVVGYFFNGLMCGPIRCGCVGSDCGELFESIAACDRAYQACYERRGVSRECTTHADCTLINRTCCPTCGVPTVDHILAVRDGTSWSALSTAGICLGDPSEGCAECVSVDNPALYAACVEGQCQAFDVGDAATCDSDDDCSARHKDCCGCREAAGADLVAANQSFFRPDYCPLAMSCVACNPPVIAADNVRVSCDTGAGKCRLGLLPR